MLGLPSGLVRIALQRAEKLAGRSAAPGAFKLEVGDQVVFTGELSVPRGQLEHLVQQAGLKSRVHKYPILGVTGSDAAA
jgi:hypothetical protein